MAYFFSKMLKNSHFSTFQRDKDVIMISTHTFKEEGVLENGWLVSLGIVESLQLAEACVSFDHIDSEGF